MFRRFLRHKIIRDKDLLLTFPKPPLFPRLLPRTSVGNVHLGLTKIAPKGKGLVLLQPEPKNQKERDGLGFTKNAEVQQRHWRLKKLQNVYLNETAPRWENHSHPASPRRPCFALASRHKSLAQTAPLARATNLRIKANRVP